MLGATKAYLFGAQSIGEYNFAVSAPFFGGFVLVGFFGLLQIIRNVGSKECLYGFFVVGFCYVGLEILFQATGG